MTISSGLRGEPRQIGNGVSVLANGRLRDRCSSRFRVPVGISFPRQRIPVAGP